MPAKRRPPGSEAPFVAVGRYAVDGPAAVEVRTEGTTGHVVIDAVPFLPVPR